MSKSQMAPKIVDVMLKWSIVSSSCVLVNRLGKFSLKYIVPAIHIVLHASQITRDRPVHRIRVSDLEVYM